MFKGVFMKFKLTPATKDGGILGFPISRLRWTAQKVWSPASSHVSISDADWDRGRICFIAYVAYPNKYNKPRFKKCKAHKSLCAGSILFLNS